MNGFVYFRVNLKVNGLKKNTNLLTIVSYSGNVYNKYSLLYNLSLLHNIVIKNIFF